MSKYVDIISTSPNYFICYMISLLHIMDAIYKSIFSSRWRNIIYYVPVLDLTCHFPTLAFINTLHKLLPSTSKSTNLQTIQKLWMQIGVCRWQIIPIYINSWVCSKINRKVVDLVIILPDFVSNTVENH